MSKHYPDGHNVGLGMVYDTPEEKEIERLKQKVRAMTQIPAKPPYVLPIVLPVRFEHIPYEGEIWYDATDRMLDAEEVCNAINGVLPQSHRNSTKEN